MIISSLALVLAAAMPVSPLSNPIHLHPRVKVQDDRISFTLVNPAPTFRDIRIDGQTYTVDSHHTLRVKAPAGTIVFVASPSRGHKRGDILLEITPAQSNTSVRLN